MSSLSSNYSSKALVILVVVCIVVATFLSVYNYLIRKDFILYIKAPCNPSVSSCFVHDCEDGDVRCDTASGGIVYYKIVLKKERNIIPCSSEDCTELKCESGEDSCEEIFCSEEALQQFALEDNCSE